MIDAARVPLGRGSGIGARMALVGAVLAIPMLVLAIHLARENRAAQIEEARTRALSIARSLATQPAHAIRMARLQLEALGRQVPDPEAPECRATLERALAVQPLFEQLAAVNANGDVVCRTRPREERVNIADREYFRRALGEQRFQVSGLVLGRASKTWMMVGAQPVERGALLGAFNLAWFQELVSALPASEGLLISVVDESGRLLARRPYEPGLIGRRIQEPERFREALRTGPEGVHEVRTLDGARRIMAFSAVPGSQLYVRVGVPIDELDGAGTEVLLKTLAATTVVLALALGLAWAMFRWLVAGPMGALVRAAARLGEGDLKARTGLAHDMPVVGALARKFDQLAAHGEQVARALRTLSAGNRALLRERDERALLDAMCRAAVEIGGYVAAYVCYARQDEARSIEVMTKAGADRGFLDAVALTWADTELGRGSIGRCIRSGEAVVLHSIAGDAGAAPWHAAARSHGFGSIASLPLRVQGALIGTFTLAAGETDAFDADELRLLEEMAADLSFGIDVIRAESRRRQAEDIARRALTRDGVVDLPSRAAFVRRVTECIERSRGNGEPVAVLDVHLGRLQDVFDSFGYEHGNALLRQIAERLKRLPGWEDSMGRLPVDDFGVVLCGQDADDAARSAKRVVDALEEPLRIGGTLIDMQASVGAAFCPGHGEDAEALVRRASITAREAFRREVPYAVYGGATARENPARLALAADLRGAIETRQLALHYQPKVRLADGLHTGGEALVRWPHPSRGPVPPAEFVALAEEIGLIRALTYEVLDLAVRQLHNWGATTPIAINLSARNLLDPNLLPALDGLFGTWGVARDRIDFEITESALVDDPEAARRVLFALRDRGSRIYIDDFGTGYSSLSYLVKLPVHALKIDRSFVAQLTKSPRAAGIVTSVISMAHGLGVSVVAEGVESREEAAMLRDMGCDEAQGFYFARPLPATDYAAWKPQPRG